MHALEVKNLSVRYGAVHAVRDVSMAVAEGSITVLLGANGAGKSSTLKAIMGLVPHHAGSVELFGKPVGTSSTAELVRGGITLSPEGRRVFSGLSVEENLIMGAASARHLVNKLPQNKDRVFNLFPILGERRVQLAGSLSGGEQQMLAIGRALMSEPRVLLLDEPSLGLAPIIIDQIFDLIIQLKSAGLTILLVEQNAERALEIGDFGYLLKSGQISDAGTAREMLASTNLTESYLGA